MTPPALRALLAGAIDYAGLFPPAALPMAEAVRCYASYREGRDAWALGRFIVPIARLGELGDSIRMLGRGGASPWGLSVLSAKSGAADWADAQRGALGGAVIEAIELRATSPDDVLCANGLLPRHVQVFYEIPIESDPAPLLATIAQAGGLAKVRTGGITPEAFPRATDLARFLATCARLGVRFKATAGLHHPLRARYRLTYAADSPSGEMFGFLNVLLAAAFARAGVGEQQLAELLTERNPSAIKFSASAVEWRGQRVSVEDILQSRATLALSFGSCSFREPIEELTALGLL